MATVRQKVETYAITISTFQQHRHFQKTTNAELFIQTLLQYRAQGRFLLHAYVVMPNHVHVLVTPGVDVSTAKAVQYIKGGYSHALGQKAIWHSGYHAHRVREGRDFEAQRLYIANNPVRKRYEAYPHVDAEIDPAPGHLGPG
jgi:putative transposase